MKRDFGRRPIVILPSWRLLRIPVEHHSRVESAFTVTRSPTVLFSTTSTRPTYGLRARPLLLNVSAIAPVQTRRADCRCKWKRGRFMWRISAFRRDEHGSHTRRRLHPRHQMQLRQSLEPRIAVYLKLPTKKLRFRAIIETIKYVRVARNINAKYACG